MLCAVSALSLYGCSGDLYEEDNIAEEASSDSAQTTEIKSDEKNKTGITEEELDLYFDESINEMAKAQEYTPDEMRKELKTQYDERLFCVKKQRRDDRRNSCRRNGSR